MWSLQALESQHRAELMQARAEASLSAVSSPWLTPLQPQHRSSLPEALSISLKPSETTYRCHDSQRHPSENSHGSGGNKDLQHSRDIPESGVADRLRSVRHDEACLQHSRQDPSEASCSCELENLPEICSPRPAAPEILYAGQPGHPHATPESSSSPEILGAQHAVRTSQSHGLPRHKHQVSGHLLWLSATVLPAIACWVHTQCPHLRQRLAC